MKHNIKGNKDLTDLQEQENLHSVKITFWIRKVNCNLQININLM